MDVRIGSKVIGTGGSLGEVHRVIVDARTNTVTDLVVKHGFLFGGERMVPLSCVTAVDDEGAVHVQLDEKEFEGMEGFTSDHFRAPDPNYVGPPGYHNESFLLNTGVMMSTGTGGGFYGKPLGFPGGEQTSPSDQQRPSISAGTPISDPDGNKLGEVHEFEWAADGGAPSRLVMRRGMLFHTDTELPLEWVQNLSDEGVILNVPRSRVEALAEAGTPEAGRRS